MICMYWAEAEPMAGARQTYVGLVAEPDGTLLTSPDGGETWKLASDEESQTQPIHGGDGCVCT